MKPREKLALIEEIAAAFSSFTMDKTEYIFIQYGYFPYQFQTYYTSSSEMAYETLKAFNESDLFKIAQDHDVELNSVPPPPSPSLWKQNYVRLFLSHSTIDKAMATKLKTALIPWRIDLFVAHQDIDISEEWRREIIIALGSMDAFAALLTANFKSSGWTDQEFGIAFAKNAVIIPLIYDVNPYGFMESTQGTKIKNVTPQNVTTSIAKILVKKNKTREKMIESLFNLILESQIIKEFEERLQRVEKLKDEIGIEYFNQLRLKILDNIFFNQLDWIMVFNSFVKKNFKNEIEPISKKIFNERHSDVLDDDRLPF